MNRTFIISRHEFLRTIRRTGFIVLTLALPVLAVLGIGVFQVVSGITKPPPQAINIGYVDEAGNFTQSSTRGNINIIRFESQGTATKAVINKEIAEYFIIPPDFLATGRINLFTTRNELTPPTATLDAIKHFTTFNLLSEKVAGEVIQIVENPLNLVTTSITSTGEAAARQGGFASLIVPGIFAVLLMFSLMFSSTYVLQSLGEEKENRLMEILLSSISTRQLLVGKVVGVGAAGLLQVTVWLISFPVLLRLASSSIGGFIDSVKIPAEFWILGPLYFILGYFFFAVVSSCIAAVTSTVQEGQGIAGLYTFFSAAPFWFLSLLMSYPDNPVWIVFSMFPFSAPVLVMIRLGITGIPAWQLTASLAVMALSIAGGLLLAGKLLRTYNLMYGKRPGLREIIRNLRTTQ